MKAVRFSSVVLAILLVAVAFSPVAAKPVVAPLDPQLALSAPVQSFLALPWVASIGAAAPSLSIDVENAAGANGYSCALVSQRPADYTKMVSRQYFDATWVIQNTGSVWYSKGIQFKYIGGAKMQTRGNSFSLHSNVSRGKKVALTVDMTAPKALGGYSTVWGLYVNNKVFCKVTLIVAVTSY